MRTFKQFITVSAVVLGLSLTINAGDTADAAKADKTNDKTELHHQTNCPVMGGKIDSTLFTDIQGQRVYHCCPMCAPKLKADPDKYFKKAAADGVQFENIQTICPVSGDSLKDKSVFVDFEGRRIAFCSDDCRDKFNQDPAAYLSKMMAPADAKTAGSAKMEDMKNMKHMDQMKQGEQKDQKH